MKWFNSLGTKVKVGIGVGFILVMLLLVVGMANRSLGVLQATQTQINEINAIRTDPVKLRAGLNGQRAEVFEMMLAAGKDNQMKHAQAIKQRASEVDTMLEDLERRGGGNAILANSVQELKTMREQFRRTRDTEVIPMIYRGEMDKAKQLQLGIQGERHKKILAVVKQIEKDSSAQALAQAAQTQQIANSTAFNFGIISLLAFIISILVLIILLCSVRNAPPLAADEPASD